MESLASRFRREGKTDEVLDFVKKWGVLPAMDEYGVRCYLAMEKFLKETTGDENFGINPLYADHSGAGNKDLFTVVREKMEAYVSRTEKKITEMDAEIERLTAENSLLKRHFYETYGARLLEIVETLPG